MLQSCGNDGVLATDGSYLAVSGPLHVMAPGEAGIDLADGTAAELAQVAVEDAGTAAFEASDATLRLAGVTSTDAAGFGLYALRSAVDIDGASFTGTSSRFVDAGDGVLLRDGPIPPTLRDVLLDGNARAGLVVEGDGGAVAGGSITSNTWAVVQVGCENPLTLTGVDIHDNGDDTPYLCAAGPSLALP
jgi:hypothetical protein